MHMKYLKNIGFYILKGMRFLPYSMVLFLFCGCNNSPKIVTDSLQETVIEIDNQTIDCEKQTKTEIVYIYVCGAVQNPGVYQLEESARVYEAIEAAGGLRDDASQTAVNLAEKISDGQQIYVPTYDEEESILLQKAEEQSGLININTADASKLQQLPGIGKSRADAIIAYRENNGLFTTIEDIMNVSGIKSSVFEQIRGYITV